jgi:hypothetical protein
VGIGGFSQQPSEHFSYHLAIRFHLPRTAVAQPYVGCPSLQHRGGIADLNLGAKEFTRMWVTRNETRWICASVGHGVEPLF